MINQVQVEILQCMELLAESCNVALRSIKTIERHQCCTEPSAHDLTVAGCIRARLEETAANAAKIRAMLQRYNSENKR